MSYPSATKLVLVNLTLIASAASIGTAAEDSLGAAESSRPTARWPWSELIEPAIPTVSTEHRIANPIDAFVIDKLEQKGLRPSPLVGRRVLLRRAYFDLLGLPPKPEDVVRFVADDSADAYQREIERLLDSAHYGERWARHWLDLVRYADTGGGGLDFPLPHMWRYRDYVIRAFNQDRPYDRFVREQIAGDAYPLFGDEGKIATGFHRLGVFVEGTREEMRRDLLNDIVGTVGSVFMGVTLGCARCHDHKFDPIPTRDYYSLEAFFAPITVYPDAVPFTEYEDGEKWKERGQQLDKKIKAAQSQRSELRQSFRARVEKALAFQLTSNQDLKDLVVPISDGEVNAAVELGELFTPEEVEHYQKLAKVEQRESLLRNRYEPKAYTATELLGADNTPGPNYPISPTTYVLVSGDPKQRGELVEPAFLSGATGSDQPIDLDGVRESRRRALAEWIVSPQNPLTARVMINRIWQYHFGVGLVKTPSDLGENGLGTVHQDLVDWLACQFIDSGWSIKAMHRLIMTSNAYRRSLRHPNFEDHQRIDPAAEYWWRRVPIRLEGETIRDSILAVSGLLNPEMGGPGFFPEIDQEVMAGASTSWEPSPIAQRNRRTIYMFQKRGLVHPLLRVFDGANLNESCSVRGMTTVTPQAFALLNSEFAHRASQAMSERIYEEIGDASDSRHNLERQVTRAYELALQRPPSELEMSRSTDFLRDRPLADLCLVVLNLNEFVFPE